MKPVPGRIAPIVVRLVIVHVDAVAVDALAEAVAGAMQDLRAVARHPAAPCGPRDRPASRAGPRPRGPTSARARWLRRGPRQSPRRRGPAVRAQDPVNPTHVISAYTAPGFGSLPHRSSSTSWPFPIGCEPVGPGQIVRIAGVGVDGDHRILVRDQPFVTKPARHELLDVVFGGRRAGAHAFADGIERAILDAVERVGREAMRRDLRVGPARVEPLHEIARRDDLDAARADRLDRACVDPREIGDVAARRILHREAPDAVEERVESARRAHCGRRI